MLIVPFSEATRTPEEDVAVILERMNEALERGLSMPPVTNEELVRRRRGDVAVRRRKSPPKKRSEGTQ